VGSTSGFVERVELAEAPSEASKDTMPRTPAAAISARTNADEKDREPQR
jgi:hypothetical protein